MDPATATLLLILSVGALTSLMALYVAIPYPPDRYRINNLSNTPFAQQLRKEQAARKRRELRRMAA